MRLFDADRERISRDDRKSFTLDDVSFLLSFLSARNRLKGISFRVNNLNVAGSYYDGQTADQEKPEDMLQDEG